MMGWLLWGAYGTTATLNAYQFPPLLSTAAGSLLCVVWICMNVSSRVLIKNFLGGCADVFFRQIAVSGAHKLNTGSGPLLLAIAPHSNQFIDPMVILKTFERPIGFLCAAKSMRYTKSFADVVAFFARALGAVPVERAQDLAKVASGTVRVDKLTVHGDGTKFTSELKVGDQLFVTEGVAKGASAKVVDVVSDSILTLGAHLEDDKTWRFENCASSRFKIVPKLDHHELYSAVYDRLDEGGAIGIFPEGGSHDRASLLPLKAGIAVMALGACEQHGEPLRQRIRIVAVGLNYFSGHRFRSRVFVDYGEPFEISSELMTLYKTDKRAAGDLLMTQILDAVKAVTVQATDHEMQESLWMLRRLYVPDGQKLSLGEKVALTRGFASACQHDAADPAVAALLKRVAAYHALLKHYKIHDRRVLLSGASDQSLLDPLDALTMIGVRVAVLLSYAGAVVPGLLLASPLIVLSDVISRQKAKAAVAGSRVKLEGKDVIGTWKVLCGIIFVPIMHVCYTGFVYAYFSFQFSVAYFFFMPFVSATSILASERFFEVFNSIGPLWVLVTNQSGGAELRQQRRGLQRDLRTLATKLGWVAIIRKSGSEGCFKDFEQD